MTRAWSHARTCSRHSRWPLERARAAACLRATAAGPRRGGAPGPTRHRQPACRTGAGAQARPGDPKRSRQPRRHGCAHLLAQPGRAARLLRSDRAGRPGAGAIRCAAPPWPAGRGRDAARHRRHQYPSRCDLQPRPADRRGGAAAPHRARTRCRRGSLPRGQRLACRTRDRTARPRQPRPAHAARAPRRGGARTGRGGLPAAARGRAAGAAGRAAGRARAHGRACARADDAGGAGRRPQPAPPRRRRRAALRAMSGACLPRPGQRVAARLGSAAGDGGRGLRRAPPEPGGSADLLACTLFLDRQARA